MTRRAERFERILAAKGRLRDALRGDLAEADRVVDDAAREEAEAQAHGHELRSAIVGTDLASADDLARRAALVELSRRRVEVARAALADARARREETRAALERSSREVRGLEAATARQARRAQESLARRERGLVDDMVTTRALRREDGGTP